MNKPKLDILLRMAVELDEFEAGARRASPSRQPRLVHDAVTLRSQPILWRSGRAVATAAAIALALLWSQGQTRRVEQVRPQLAASGPQCAVDYWPGTKRADGLRIDCFEPSPTEPCTVMAVFRAWQGDCQCLSWQLYEWEDGRSLAELSPEEVRGITLDVTDAPPVEQLLVVAITKDPSKLPRDEAQASELLDCLHEVDPPAGTQESTTAYASAVQACLPEGVTIVPHAFVSE